MGAMSSEMNGLVNGYQDAILGKSLRWLYDPTFDGSPGGYSVGGPSAWTPLTPWLPISLVERFSMWLWVQTAGGVDTISELRWRVKPNLAFVKDTTELKLLGLAFGDVPGKWYQNSDYPTWPTIPSAGWGRAEARSTGTGSDCMAKCCLWGIPR